MKKLTLLLFCIATLVLASCKKTTVIQQDNSLPNQTVLFTINAGDWTQDTQDGQTLFKILDLSKYLDPATFENYGLLVYISEGDNDTYSQIPNVYNQLSYSYLLDKNKRSLEIDLQRSDRATQYPTIPNFPIRVKVVFVTSQLSQ